MTIRKKLEEYCGSGLVRTDPRLGIPEDEKRKMGIAAYNRGTQAISAQIDRELIGSNATVAVVHPPAEPPAPPPTKPVTGYWPLTQDPAGPAKVGERVFCTVTACRGWYTVIESKIRGGVPQIRTDGFSGWGYAHNFTREPADWQLR